MDNESKETVSFGQFSPAKSVSIGSLLRNPLVIYGLILVAGDGPLTIAYVFSKDWLQQWVLLICMVLFIAGMGAFFCYLVAYKPRHLYAPAEIPESSIGKSIYNDFAKVTAQDKENLPQLAKPIPNFIVRGEGLTGQVATENTQPVKDEFNKVHQQATYWFFKYLYLNLSQSDKWALKFILAKKPEGIKNDDLVRWHKEFSDEILKVINADERDRDAFDIMTTLSDFGLIQWDGSGMSITDLGEAFLKFYEQEGGRVTSVLETVFLAERYYETKK